MTTHPDEIGGCPASKMYFFWLAVISTVYSPLVLPCPVTSLIPGTKHYKPTERTVLAPIVFQGRVHNTTTTDDPIGQLFYACVQVRRVFKTPFKIPPEICFGSFGAEDLCWTYVFEGQDYVFFMNKDFTARYDGYPVAALPATKDFVDDVQRGYCKGQEPKLQDCGKAILLNYQDIGANKIYSVSWSENYNKSTRVTSVIMLIDFYVRKRMYKDEKKHVVLKHSPIIRSCDFFLLTLAKN